MPSLNILRSDYHKIQIMWWDIPLLNHNIVHYSHSHMKMTICRHTEKSLIMENCKWLVLGDFLRYLLIMLQHAMLKGRNKMMAGWKMIGPLIMRHHDWWIILMFGSFEQTLWAPKIFIWIKLRQWLPHSYWADTSIAERLHLLLICAIDIVH